MIPKWGFFFLTLISAPSWQDEVQKIDQQIQQLRDLESRYRSSVEKKVNNAMRWQFQNENYLDARRTWDQAALEKQKIKEIQDHITKLEARKQKILQEHG